MPIIQHQSFDAERSKSCPHLEDDASLDVEKPSTIMLYPDLARSESLDSILLFSHDSKTGSWKCNLISSPTHPEIAPLKLKETKPINAGLEGGSLYCDAQFPERDDHLCLKSLSDVEIFPQQPSETLSSSTVSKFFPRSFSKNDQVICELLFSTDVVDIGMAFSRLRNFCWKGIPFSYRSICWKYLFVGYLPPAKAKQRPNINRRRREYFQSARSLGVYPEIKPSFDMALFHQIEIDVPRTIPSVSLFRDPIIQAVCAPLLHPSSGYVQGLNDLLSPFIAIFLSEYLCAFPIFRNSKRMNNNVLDYLLHLPDQYMQNISTEELEAVEADAFWCFSKFLDTIHDRYTSGQPGIWHQISKLEDLMARIDPFLLSHLKEQGVELNQFAFRWINCLLIRELPFRLVIRLWDTCFAEGEDGFLNFYTYITASFFMTWSNKDILLLLQNLPTGNWTDEQISVLCSEAFILMELFSKTKGHIKCQSAPSSPT
ncbi:hypothetical protein DI09_47p20 [Mitosporidium daphniae]|uniref:Rab-GAP TBC domain-containing protein n=1 Tax=Mitosporidium daphniae TaxID=1485682 RepID=A0A098VQD8_9MICR|nr:uncharacterized protein DI09_47p20 [Mitosporidium daphniae]KGG51024.1 hypothetical protein DI09_47p20 [Mitosporidium daphniae]|eukprot:XP_013237475.1 uncharacterized protein DI09_47p20 [Mitosporidium daphniae]